MIPPAFYFRIIPYRMCILEGSGSSLMKGVSSIAINSIGHQSQLISNPVSIPELVIIPLMGTRMSPSKDSIGLGLYSRVIHS